MFKLLFKLIGSVILVIAIIVGVAVWKGGEPFRWVGDGTIIIGEAIKEVGNTIDEIKQGITQGQKQAAKKIIDLKNDLDSVKGKKKAGEITQPAVRQDSLSGNKDGTVNKN
ncbi:MAG TPA: hypothetical protein ENH40_05895 [Nitrospirae bacterium]|nr:hypothetical protein [Nitrospirota bacterium]